MPYRVTQSGEIICDTAAEAIALAKALAGTDSQPSRKTELDIENDTTSRWTESRHRDFMSILKGDHQRHFLALLFERPHGMTDKALRQALGLESNLQLAGVTAGLAKSAKKVGIFPSSEVFVKEVIHQGDERVLEYKLADSFRAIAEKVHMKGVK